MKLRPTLARRGWPAATLAAALAAVVALLLFASPGARADDDDGGIKEPPGMRVIKTKYYSVHTDLKDEDFTKDLTTRMDIMYEQYVRAWPEFRPPAKAAAQPVYIFESKAKYGSFVGVAAAANTGGLFRGGPHAYLTSFLEGQGRDALRRTLQHEAFHQFAYFNISRAIPTWLNEGLAQVFEEGIWTGKTFILGQIPPRRIRQLQADVQKHALVTFDKFLFITNRQWGESLHASLEQGATNYNEAWAVAHFLSEGNNPDMRKKLVQLLQRLHVDENTDPTDAFKQYFSDTRSFQNRFDRWAQTMRPTPEATLIERQETLGDFLIGLSNEGKKYDTIAEFRGDVVGSGMAMSYTHGAVKYSTDKDPAVYFSDLSGKLYTDAQLLLEPVAGAPLPDIVCHPNGLFVVRTHFYKGAAHLEHEVSIVPNGGGMSRRR